MVEFGETAGCHVYSVQSTVYTHVFVTIASIQQQKMCNLTRINLIITCDVTENWTSRKFKLQATIVAVFRTHSVHRSLFAQLRLYIVHWHYGRFDRDHDHARNRQILATPNTKHLKNVDSILCRYFRRFCRYSFVRSFVWRSIHQPPADATLTRRKRHHFS